MTGIKVGWIPLFRSHHVASTRIRCINIVEELRKRGLDAELFTQHKFDSYSILVFLKAYERDHVALARKAKRGGKRVVFDICDNHFIKANETTSERNRISYLEEMLSLSDEIVVSTEVLRKTVIERHPSLASRITVIGDAVEESLPRSHFFGEVVERIMLFFLRLFIHVQGKAGRTPLVWFGIHGGKNADYGMQDLFKISDNLNTLTKTHNISLTIISNNYLKYRALSKAFMVPIFYMPWGGSTFFNALSMHRICIIPITRNSFTECKSNNRVALSISRGLAVVTSTPIPAYEEFLPYIKAGDINAGIRTYIDNPARATADVSAGKVYVGQHYSLKPIVSKWAALLLGINTHEQSIPNVKIL